MKLSRSCLPLLASLALLASAASRADSLPEGSDFGAALRLEQTTALAEILRDPERFSAAPVLLHGRIADVCQRKGCWTILRDGEDQIRVRFQDYGFFLPKDCTGAEAYAEGRVSVVTLSEREARHFESESRLGDPAAVDGPRREVTFTASGVRLVRRD